MSEKYKNYIIMRCDSAQGAVEFTHVDYQPLDSSDERHGFAKSEKEAKEFVDDMEGQ